MTDKLHFTNILQPIRLRWPRSNTVFNRLRWIYNIYSPWCMVLFYFLFPAHNIWIYTYFLYAPNFVVCVCIRMCRNFEAVRVTIPFRLYYHSIRWRVSVQMCIKHFEKMALITLYILLILSSIQFVQRSNGITWSNCTHMVLSDVSDISHSNRRLSFRRHACFSSVFFSSAVIAPSFNIMCWILIRYLPLVVQSIQMITSWLRFFSLLVYLLFSLHWHLLALWM